MTILPNESGSGEFYLATSVLNLLASGVTSVPDGFRILERTVRVVGLDFVLVTSRLPDSKIMGVPHIWYELLLQRKAVVNGEYLSAFSSAPAIKL